MISFIVVTVISLIFFIFELRGVSEKVSRFMLYITSGAIFVLIGFNRFNPDYKGYSGSFYNGNDNLEIGYRFINYILHSLNLPFEFLVFLIGLLILTTLLTIANTNYNQLIILGYLIFPLAFDLPQLRNTIMYLGIILAFVLLRKRHQFYIGTGVVFASTMHILGILYLPLAFLIKLDRKRFYRILGILFGLLAISAVVIRIMTATMSLPDQISEEIDPFEWFYFAVQVLHTIIEFTTFWWIDRKLQKLDIGQQDSKLEIFYRFGLYSILYLPLVAVSTEMYRFRRNAQLIKYAYSASAMKHLDLKEKIILLGLIGASITLTLGMMFVAGDLYVYQYFDFNMLLSRFTTP